MFDERNRHKRLAAEAKAIKRKADRHGGKVSSRDAQRLARVSGSLVKYGVRDVEDDSNYEGDWD